MLAQRRGDERYARRRIAPIPQDASLALNPVLRVGDQLLEVIRRHVTASGPPSAQRMREVLTRVGLDDPERVLRRTRAPLSGGMKQRVAIALALCDRAGSCSSPTTRPRRSTSRSRRRSSATCSISPGAGALRALRLPRPARRSRRCARAVVSLYAGQVAEIGPAHRIVDNARHPYYVGPRQLLAEDRAASTPCRCCPAPRPARTACPAAASTPRCPRRRPAPPERPDLDEPGRPRRLLEPRAMTPSLRSPAS